MKKKRINIIAAVILSLLFIIGCGGGGGGDSKKVIAEPKLSLSEASYDFGGVPVLKSEERQFTITNTGTRDLRITGFSPSNAQFTVPTVSDNCSGKSVVPNGSCTFIARFTPSAHGDQSGPITINGDDPKTISLNGSGWLNVWINRITGDCSSGISMDVTVTDPLNPLRLDSLTEDKFILKLGSTTQDINVSDNVFPDPVSLVLMLDMSTSQTVNIDTIKLAAKSFIDQLQGIDEAAICMFSTSRDFYPKSPDPYFLEILTGRTALKNYIDSYTLTSGETTLYDSIYESITRAAEHGTKGKKAVVVLSDGVDTASNYTLPEVADYAKLKGVLLFTIFYVDSAYYPNALADTLKQLASETSGLYYNSGNSDDLTVIFEEIAKSLSNKYIITYTPLSCSPGLIIYPQVQVNWEDKTGQTSGAYTIPTIP